MKKYLRNYEMMMMMLMLMIVGSMRPEKKLRQELDTRLDQEN